MIKLNSAARTLIGITCLAAAGMSAAGCSTTANASPADAGARPTEASATPTNTAPAVVLPTRTAPSARPGNGPTMPPATPAVAAGVSRCHTSELSAYFTVVIGSAAAGSISYNLRLTNTSPNQCTIYGYAGMLLLDANHKPLPTNVQWDSLVPKELVRLGPGGSVAATVRFSPDVPGTGDNFARYGTCEPTAYYTEVTPPDETTQLVPAVSPPTPVCERGTMAVSAFIAGATGPNQ